MAKIVQIEVYSGIKVPHPLESYANISKGVTITAKLGPSEDFDTVMAWADALGGKAVYLAAEAERGRILEQRDGLRRTEKIKQMEGDITQRQQTLEAYKAGEENVSVDDDVPF